MRHIPYPPTCGVDFVEIDADKNQSTLTIVSLVQANDDRNDLPVSEDKKIEIPTIIHEEILTAIENETGFKAMRLDPA